MITLCACGCSLPAPIAQRNNARLGHVKGEPLPYRTGHCHRRPALERFYEKVEKTETCWLWIGGERREYGTFWDGEQVVLSHRWSYETFVGPIPDDLQIDHLCRTPRCVNPAHLEPVTPRENAMRGISFSAVNAKKTHCVNGHEFTPENTYVHVGARHCRACNRARSRARGIAS